MPTRTAGDRPGDLIVLRARATEIERSLAHGVVRQLFEPLMRTAGARRRATLFEGAARHARHLREPARSETGAPTGDDAEFAVPLRRRCRPGRHRGAGGRGPAAGASASIDMALTLTDRVHGCELAEALQLVIEYDPPPPFDSGSLGKASPATRRRAPRLLLSDRPVQTARRVATHMARSRLKRARQALTTRSLRAASLRLSPPE